MGCGLSTASNDNMGLGGSKDAQAARTSSSASEVASDRKGVRAGLVARDSRDPYTVYEKIKTLGHGMSGDVWLVRHRTTGDMFALKALEKERLGDPELLNDLKNEIELLRTLDSPNVIKLYQYYESPRAIFLVLELLEGGELFDRLKAQRGDKFTEPYAAWLLSKMLAAVAYCHGQGVSHRDLKLENFLFETNRWDSNLKLIDFGLSRKYVVGAGGTDGGVIQTMESSVGTSYYQAPEVLDESCPYTQACDIWSLGVIAFMLLSGRAPFHGRGSRGIQNSVLRGKFTFAPKYWHGISEDAKNFVRCCLVYDPAKRATAQQLLDHKWIRLVRSEGGKEARRLDSRSLGRRAAEGMDQSDMPISSEVVAALRDFSKFSRIKRLALETIAFRMSAKEIVNVRGAFERLDTDRTGVLSMREVVQVLKEEGGMTEEQALEMFTAMDQDKRQVVSYSEFLAAALSQRFHQDERRIRDAFERLDVDGTGYVTQENLRQVLGDDLASIGGEAGLREMIAEADSAGDGKLDWHEFLAAVRSGGTQKVEEVLGEPNAVAVRMRVRKEKLAGGGEATGLEGGAEEGGAAGGGGGDSEGKGPDAEVGSAAADGGVNPSSIAGGKAHAAGDEGIGMAAVRAGEGEMPPDKRTSAAMHIPSLMSATAAGAGFGVAPVGREDTGGSYDRSVGASSGSLVMEGGAAPGGMVEGGASGAVDKPGTERDGPEGHQLGGARAIRLREVAEARQHEKAMLAEAAAAAAEGGPSGAGIDEETMTPVGIGDGSAGGSGGST